MGQEVTTGANYDTATCPLTLKLPIRRARAVHIIPVVQLPGVGSVFMNFL